MGGSSPNALTSDGVTQLFAVNVLGHAVLLDALLKADKLTTVAVFSGSEAARGVSRMGMKRPSLPTSSMADFKSIADGSHFTPDVDPMVSYGPVKYLGAMWMAGMAREYPNIRFVTMSPGGTSGTDAINKLSGPQKFFMTWIGMPLMPLFGMMHGLETGAKRYVDAINDAQYATGHFYASHDPYTTGDIVDQSTIFSDLSDHSFQDNAKAAVYEFVA